MGPNLQLGGLIISIKKYPLKIRSNWGRTLLSLNSMLFLINFSPQAVIKYSKELLLLVFNVGIVRALCKTLCFQHYVTEE
jgi:hypothetical protein